MRAGRLFDSEAGTFLENQDILVRGRRIEAVGPGLTIPEGAELIDLRNYTVLPGLIDAHTHLLYLEDPSGSLTTDGLKALVLEGTALRALHGAGRARTFLDAGITTVRDLGNSGNLGDVALQRAIQDGSVEGPRMIVSGPGLSPVGGQFRGLRREYAELAADEYRIVKGPEDAAEAVRENVTFGADVIKIFSNNTPSPLYLSLAEMRAIVAEAEVLGVRVAAHATNDRAVWQAVEAGVHSIEHGYQVADSTLRFMKERGVALVPTDADSVTIVRYLERTERYSPERVRSYLASHRDRLMRAKAAGVTIVAGSDAYIDLGVPQGEAARRVLFAYHQAGLTPGEVLQAATINGAKLMGGEGRVGVIKAGAFADIIALEGNPEADFDALERVRFVMKEGRVYRRP
jgi:imidazolonepropionase-like amidohydrolase